MGLIEEKLSNSAGLKRIEMPQIAFEDISNTVAALLANGVGVEVSAIPAKKLKFAQEEIDFDKVKQKIDSKSKQYKNRFFFTSRAKFIADGHHDLANCLEVAPNTKLICFVCDLNIYELVDFLNELKFTSNEK